MNLEMAATAEMLAIACDVRPAECCLVPERREELTTEGGLDAAGAVPALKYYCAALADAGVRVSLFIDADPRQIEAAAAIGAPVVEIHTGHYASAATPAAREQELVRIADAVRRGVDAGLYVNAGHGLDYHNVKAVAAIDGVRELNIGHSIIARALFTGLAEAVAEMKRLIRVG
jgi:pyridoxine 5-phosphate synthase